MTYKTHYSRDEKNDDVFEVHDPEGTVLIVLSEPADADELVDHLNAPFCGGGYEIEEFGDDSFDLIDSAGDTILSFHQRSVLESLLTHLNRNH